MFRRKPGRQRATKSTDYLQTRNRRRIPAFPFAAATAGLALTTPREERGREICRIAMTYRWAGLFLWGIRVRLHQLPIKMPGGMTEHRQNDGETDEERHRTDHQQSRTNQPPYGHRKRVLLHCPQRRPDRVYRRRMPVEHQRKRHNTDA